jgi:hypothetical protein
VRTLVSVLLACLLVACAPSPSAPATTVPRGDGSGLVAVYSVGGRNVRVLIVRPPSIVLAHEAFVPAGESVRAVHWERAELVIETNAQRYALDTQTWSIATDADRAGGVASARERPRS